jgi:rhodanese-related sulfurtransferase
MPPEAASTAGVFADPEIEVSPRRVADLMATDPAVQVVDVREPYEHEAGHIAGARHIELERLAARAATIDARRPVIFHCRLGVRSAMAAHAFRRAGYDAYSMRGGLVRWAAEGLPLAPEDGFVADH